MKLRHKYLSGRKVNKLFIRELKAYAPGKDLATITKRFYPVAKSTIWYYLRKYDIKWKREKFFKNEKVTVPATKPKYFRHEDFKGII